MYVCFWKIDRVTREDLPEPEEPKTNTDNFLELSVDEVTFIMIIKSQN